MSAFALPIVLARAPVAVSPDPNNTTTTTTTAAPNKLDDIVIENDITTTVVSLEIVCGWDLKSNVFFGSQKCQIHSVTFTL